MKTIFEYIFWPVKWMLLLGIRCYQAALSPLMPASCRYHPTCSRYCYRAISRHGLIKGVSLSVNRLFRCHPWGDAGFDPVPTDSDQADRPRRKDLPSMELFLLGVSGLFLFNGCASDSNNPSLPESNEDPFAVSEDVYHKQKPRLRRAFRTMRRALLNGDLKTLKQTWIKPSGEAYSIQELSSIYERHGNQMAQQLRGAQIQDKPAIDVSLPKESIQNQHPDAKFVGIIPVRKSGGSPTLFRALFFEEENWKFIVNVNGSSNTNEQNND